MPFIKIPTDSKDPFWRRVKRYSELSGDWYGGTPVRVVCLAAAEAEADGRLNIPSNDTLESVIGWKGRRGAGERALLEAGLVVKDEDGYKVDGEIWEALGSHILKFHQRAKKAAKALWSKPTVEAISTA